MILHTQTMTGPVLGTVSGHPEVSVFRGIPYAKAPAGPLRWRAPVAPDPWETERPCLQFGPSCYQRDTWDTPAAQEERERHPCERRRLHMGEDCLSLNIWTPAQTVEDRLPVMVWFYGGGLQGGTTDDPIFDGEGLCPLGVLLVTVNYRTGVFGYLAHPQLAAENPWGASGNYGLLDQLFALEWIHRNIGFFGGDAGNVTIFGCSGGSRSTQAISCSPRSRGLIHHAICHSGSGLNPDYSTPYDQMLAMGQEFLEFCGKKTIDELRQMPAPALQAAYDAYGKWFNVTCDGYALPEPMHQAILRGHHADIEYLLCTTTDEVPQWRRKGTTLANFDAVRRQFSIRTSTLASICRPKTDQEAEDLAVYAEAYEMNASALAWAEAQLAQSRRPVYLGVFSHKLPGEGGIAGHGDDQYYVFHTLSRFWRPFGPEDEALSQTMMRYWTNFSKTGNPNGPDLTEWTPYTRQSPLAMQLDLSCHMTERQDPVMRALADAYLHPGQQG